MDAATLGPLTAFLGGIVSFVSPCVLPLVPGYISYIAGSRADDLPQQGARSRALYQAGMFVLGFSTVFVLMGAGATYIGQFLLRYRHEANLIGGVVILVFGLFMMGVLKFRWLDVEARFLHRVTGPAAPWTGYLLGLAFAFGWTPCIGPILGAILTLGASSQDVYAGMGLLAWYSAGLGVPFLLSAAFMGHFLGVRKTLQRISVPLRVIAGAVMIAMGLAMITGQFSRVALWLFNLFPGWGSIG